MSRKKCSICGQEINENQLAELQRREYDPEKPDLNICSQCFQKIKAGEIPAVALNEFRIDCGYCERENLKLSETTFGENYDRPSRIGCKFCSNTHISTIIDYPNSDSPRLAMSLAVLAWHFEDRLNEISKAIQKKI